MSSNNWLLIFATRNRPVRTGVSAVCTRPNQQMHETLDRAVKERNRKNTRSRDDWYCLCVVHGFSKKFGSAALRQSIVSVAVSASLQPERSILAKLEKALHRNRTKCRQVDLIF